MLIRAGDAVKHKPSGETWTVAAVSVDGTELVCVGWPESIAKVSDCELVTAAPNDEHIAMLHKVIEQCGDQLRGSWARENLIRWGMTGRAKDQEYGHVFVEPYLGEIEPKEGTK